MCPQHVSSQTELCSPVLPPLHFVFWKCPIYSIPERVFQSIPFSQSPVIVKLSWNPQHCSSGVLLKVRGKKIYLILSYVERQILSFMELTLISCENVHSKEKMEFSLNWNWTCLDCHWGGRNYPVLYFFAVNIKVMIFV